MPEEGHDRHHVFSVVLGRLQTCGLFRRRRWIYDVENPGVLQRRLGMDTDERLKGLEKRIRILSSWCVVVTVLFALLVVGWRPWRRPADPERDELDRGG